MDIVAAAVAAATNPIKVLRALMRGAPLRPWSVDIRRHFAFVVGEMPITHSLLVFVNFATLA